MFAPQLLADISSVEPGHLKDYIIITIGLGMVALQIIQALRTRGIQKREVSFSEEVVSKQMCTSLHTETDRRMLQCEKQIAELWNTLRSENESIRDEMRRGFQDMERALGRIEGKLDNK